MSGYLEAKQKLKESIATWRNRSFMAQKAGNEKLEQEALDMARQYKKMLDNLESIDITGLGGDPYQPSRVPEQPLPYCGAGAIALPIPERDDLT